MADRPVEQLTLREQFTTCEHLLRELIDHLDQSFLAKIRKLEEMVDPQDNPANPMERAPVLDVNIRNHVAALLSSDDFSQTLHQKLDAFLAAIEQGAGRALNEG